MLLVTVYSLTVVGLEAALEAAMALRLVEPAPDLPLLMVLGGI